MFRLSTHSGKLERWLGKESVEKLSGQMRGWYGKPIAVSGVPGRVYVGPDGDFQGRILNGLEATALDALESFARRVQGAARSQATQLNSGFGGFTDLITASKTPGKKRQYQVYKLATGMTTGACGTLWSIGNYPVAGGNASAAPGGRVPDNTTSGALPFTNPTSGTQHFVGSYFVSNQLNQNLLLYDRIFDVAKTMASTATEAVTGVPTRYQNTTAGSIDSAENNFVFPECTTVLPATAHNWTTCLYTNQAGTTGQTIPSITGNSSNAAQRLDMPLQQWFAPLASGDNGILALTQMQCSASVATGAINFVMGHPIAWMAFPIITQMLIYDGVTSSFNFERIFDSACLAFLQPTAASGSLTTFQGTIATVTN